MRSGRAGRAAPVVPADSQQPESIHLRSKLPDAIVCTHTVPLVRWGLHLFPMYQNALRYITDSADVCLHDFHQLLQGVDQSEYLRDNHHPTLAYSESFADIIMRSARAWTSCCSSSVKHLLGCSSFGQTRQFGASHSDPSSVVHDFWG